MVTYKKFCSASNLVHISFSKFVTVASLRNSSFIKSFKVGYCVDLTSADSVMEFSEQYRRRNNCGMRPLLKGLEDVHSACITGLNW